jgi:hypothetical protein
MKKLEEKIDDYLNGALPATEVMAFEASLQADPELAAEVELQRRMQTVLSDSGEWELRQTLRTISEDYPLPAASEAQVKLVSSPSKWWYFGPVLIVVAFALVYFLDLFTPSPGKDVGLPPLETETRTEQPDSPLELTTEDTIDLAPVAEPTDTPGQTRPEPPRDARDPTSPLPALEQVLAAEASVVYDFELSVNRTLEGITLAGTLYALDLPTDSTFLLRIFNNNPVRFPGRPVLTAGFRPEQIIVNEDRIAFGRKNAYAVSFSRVLKLPMGRYYYLISTSTEPGIVLASGRVE